MIVEIGLARADELPAIWELYKTVWIATYPNHRMAISEQDVLDYLAFEKPGFTKRWGRAIKQPGLVRTVFVARLDNKIVGMVSVKFLRDRYRLTTLYVAPDVQGNGIGTKLLERGLNWCGTHDVYLYVAPYLVNAQRLYKKYGFEFLDTPFTFFAGNPVPYLEMRRLA